MTQKKIIIGSTSRSSYDFLFFDFYFKPITTRKYLFYFVELQPGIKEDYY